MNDPVALTARAAALRLAPDYGDRLLEDVEAALGGGATAQRPAQYLDPVELASLIVSTASLAWTIRRDLIAKTGGAPRDAVVRRLRATVGEGDAATAATRERVIDTVVDEMTDAEESGRAGAG